MATSSLPLRVPKGLCGDKIKHGFFTSAVSGAHVRAKWLHHPYGLRGPQHVVWRQNHKWLPHTGHHKGPSMGIEATSPWYSRARRKSQMATSYLPSRGAMCGHNGSTPLPRVPNAQHGDKMTNGYFEPVIMGVVVWAKWLYHPCPLKGPQSLVQGQNQTWLVETYRLGVHTPAKWLDHASHLNDPNTSRRDKIINGYHTPAITRAH